MSFLVNFDGLFCYQAIFISVLILLPNVHLSLYQFISFSHGPVPQALSSSHLCMLPSLPSSFPLFPLAIPHAEVCPLSSSVNNTWPLKLEGCGVRIRSLAWVVFLSVHLLGHSCSQRLASCWEEYWVTSHNTQIHTIIGNSLSVNAGTHMQNFMHALCVHEAETRMEIKCKKLHDLLCSCDAVFIFVRIMGHHHFWSFLGNLLHKPSLQCTNHFCIGNICSQQNKPLWNTGFWIL